MDVEREPRIWRHWQNLNETPGRPPTKGRAWLHLWSWVLCFEWCFSLTPSWSFGLHLNPGERDVTVGVGFLFASFYLGLEGWPQWVFDRLGIGYEGREVYIRVHDQALWWSIWTPRMLWSSDTPWYRDGSLHPLDVVLGSTAYSSTVLDTCDVVVPMPEAPYPGTFTLTEHTHKRPRWPWPSRFLSGEIDVSGGICHPGKGTCAHNCDEDATYSLSTPLTNRRRAAAKTIGAFVASVLGDRREYPL